MYCTVKHLLIGKSKQLTIIILSVRVWLRREITSFMTVFKCLKSQAKILRKYCENTAKILRKYCENIVLSYYESNNFAIIYQ